ncbi:MAG: Putative esterase, partial [uncultured Actinomycetospora sp.]
DRGVPPLGRTVLIAPALDLRLTNPEIALVEPHDPWLARPGVHVAAALWRGELPLEDPLVSPLLTDHAGLGPLTVFSGTRDITHPDTCLLVERARAAGVEVDLHEGAGLVHVYPLLPVPEGRAARAVIVRSLTGQKAGQQ